MDLVWEPFGLLGIVAMAFAFAMAAFVLAAQRERVQNRLLALLLVAEGVILGFGGGLNYFLSDPRDVYHLQWVNITTSLLLPLLQLLFLATLDTPLTRPFRTLAGRLVLAALVVAGEAYWFLHPEAFIASVVPASYAPWETAAGPAFVAWSYGIGGLSLFALLCSLHAWWRARPDSSFRGKAKALAVAFGARDSVWLLLLLVVQPVVTARPAGFLVAVYLQGFSVGTLLFVGLAAYGILRTQLFDVELKLKWTLSKGTVATVLLVSFFVVKELAEQLLGVGSVALSLAVATALALLFRPVEGLADRLVDRLMPQVQQTEAYLHGRKFEVYRAALENAWEDGDVRPKERRMLGTLASQLGLTAEEANRVESDLLRVIGARPASPPPSVAP